MERNISLPGIEPGFSVRSPALYRLSYPIAEQIFWSPERRGSVFSGAL
jgi:hypothetical protein